MFKITKILFLLNFVLFSSCAEFTFDIENNDMSKNIIFFTVDNNRAIIDKENKTITLYVPYSTDLTAISPSIKFIGKKIVPSSKIPRDFSNSKIKPLEYKVYDERGAYIIYKVTIIKSFIPFVMTIKTNNSGVSANDEFRIPMIDEGYDFTVDWGDEETEDYDYNAAGTHFLTHTYDNPGIYEITIIGDFPRIYFNNTGDKRKILNIKQWGSVHWKSFEKSFYGCSNLVIIASDTPDLSSVNNMHAMFMYASSFNSNINHWNVSTITNMNLLFKSTSFNQPLNNWDVSNVTDMGGMFNTTPFNQPLDNWDVSNVLSMSSMFNTTPFNQPLDNWDVSSVTNMSWMFNCAKYFNQPLNNWNVSNVTTMKGMFNIAKKFNQPLDNWDVSNVNNMDWILRLTYDFNQDLSNWNLAKVEKFDDLFTQTSMSVTNYSKFLEAIAATTTVPIWVRIESDRQYNDDGQIARDYLVGTLGWHITDGGHQ